MPFKVRFLRSPKRTTNTIGTSKNILTGILLCCVLIDPVIATFTYLYYQKTAVKKEVVAQILAGIDKDELVLLRFSKKDAAEKLRWEDSKEFEYKGQMYDVVETMTAADTVYYWCWLDHKETKLNRQLDDLTAKVLGHTHKIRIENKRLPSFLKSLYFANSFIWNGSESGSFCMFCGISLNLYSSVTIQPPSPPPQLG